MTSGFDYNVEDIHCTDPICLKCLNEPGQEWYYHNAPYSLLINVIESASNQNINIFYRTELANKIGMGGTYFKQDAINLLITKPRDMARFALMILANANWNGQQIISTEYVDEMTRQSQDINKSYGYLWWLNGKDQHRLPGSTFNFNGSLIPTAPSDLFAGLGKNDQKLYVFPSEDLVVIRMGNSAGTTSPALSDFDETIFNIYLR